MSYLLDALRKSENERVAQANQPVFSAPPTAYSQRPRWLVPLVGAIVIINLLAISYFFSTQKSSEGAASKALSYEADKQLDVAAIKSGSNNVDDIVEDSPAYPSQQQRKLSIVNSMPEPKLEVNPAEAAKNNLQSIVSRQPKNNASVSNLSNSQKNESSLQENLALKPEAGRIVPHSRAVPIQPKVIAKTQVKANPETVSEKVETDISRAVGALKPEIEAKNKSISEPKLDKNEEIPELRDMPENFRRNLPSLFVNVYVYADEPSERFVVVNMSKYRIGQTFKEGLLLEDIEPEFLRLRYDNRTFRFPRP